jgi:NNP family nitrate/nitrite transporter-like MFS transporter
MSGDTRPALALFLVFYLSCIAVAWWFYARPDAARRTA